MNSGYLNNRKSTRLNNHDYRLPGGYFITICSYQRNPIFGKISNGRIIQNRIGNIVEKEWFKIPIYRNYVNLHEDEFVLMPNHIHAIVWIDDYCSTSANTNSPQAKLKSRSLGAIIGQFKSKTSRLANQIRNTPGSTIWQRNYYDHIIRNQKELAAIKKYILDNPLKAEEGKGMDYPW